MSAPNFQMVMDKLQPVMDPELNISIVDLGLVRGVSIDDATGDITFPAASSAPDTSTVYTVELDNADDGVNVTVCEPAS